LRRARPPRKPAALQAAENVVSRLRAQRGENFERTRAAAAKAQRAEPQTEHLVRDELAELAAADRDLDERLKDARRELAEQRKQHSATFLNHVEPPCAMLEVRLRDQLSLLDDVLGAAGALHSYAVTNELPAPRILYGIPAAHELLRGIRRTLSETDRSCLYKNAKA